MESNLTRALTTRSLAATAFNVTVGGGIFALPAFVFTTHVGREAPMAYVLCAAAMALIVTCFAIAGSRVTSTGGPYAYVEVALGPFFGFLSGVLLYVLMLLATSAIASAFAAAVAVLIPSLGDATSRVVILFVLFASMVLLHLRGIRTGARAIEIVTVAKLLPLLLFVIVGGLLVHNVPTPPMLAPALPGALGRSVIVMIFAFAGIESALVPSGEVRNPERTVPRALAVTMIAVTLLYVAIQLIADRALGNAITDPANAGSPLAAAGRVIFGPVGATIMALGAAISMLGYASGMTLATPRALYALARDRFLPRMFARVEPRHNAPSVAIVTTCGVMFVLSATSGFAKLALLSNVAVLTLYLLCCIAALVLSRRPALQDVGLKVPGAPVIAVAGVVVIIWILANATLKELGTIAAVIAVSCVLYFVRGLIVRAEAV